MEHTKEGVRTLVMKLVRPTKNHFTKGMAGISLGGFAAGYGEKIAEMEAFSRMLWGLAPFWAGGGDDTEFSEIFRTGLAHGTNREQDEYWGDLGDKDQRMVEMAAISYGMIIATDKLWNPLSDTEKENVIAWLSQINEHTQPDNNWHFFNVITNLALKHVGAPFCRERMEYAIGRYESFYIGNGWYGDGWCETGIRPQMDYYISFGIHFYSLLYCLVMENEEEERCGVYKERAKVFAQTFLYWFDEEGKALPFGRSMTYRFAQSAFWSMCLLAGVDVYEYGVLKGLIFRHLDYWMSQPIFDNGDILTVGYAYPNLMMSEGYNAPGSPYWSMKVFAFLALPDEHPFWSAEELPFPKISQTKAVPECRMLLCHRQTVNPANAEVTALTAGQYPVMNHTHGAEKYAKFAYSSRFGFSVPRSYAFLTECAPDSMLVFYVHGMYYVRRKCTEILITENHVESVWSPLDGITVRTVLTPVKDGHERLHTISSEQDCVVYDCGFSYPQTMDLKTKVSRNKACIENKNGYSSVESEGGEGNVIATAPNSNLIFPLAQVPAVRFDIHAGTTEIKTKVLAKWEVN